MVTIRKDSVNDTRSHDILQSSSVQIAKALASRYGRSIIPTDEKKLTPILKDTFKKDGTPARLRWKPYQSKRASVKQIDQWQAEYNPPSYAQVTGAISGIVTLEFDGKTGLETLNRLGIKPHRYSGSGGPHVDFVHPGWRVKSLNHKTSAASQWAHDYPGMDIRGDGGIVLVAGRNQKGPYIWTDRDPGDLESLESLPLDLREALGLLHAPVEQEKANPKKDPAARRVRPIYESSDSPVTPISKHALEKYLADIPLLGGRDNACFSLACQLRDNGYSEQEATSVCMEFASRAPLVDAHGQLDPFTEQDAAKCVSSAYGYAKRNPWKPKSERKEFISIPHIVPQVSREEHAKLLHDASLAIRLAIHDHITRADGSVLVIQVPPGVGKSHIAAMIARDDFIVAWMAQNHAMAESIDALQDNNIVHIQPVTEDNCPTHYKEHHIMGKKRICTMSVHSKHPDGLCDAITQHEHTGTTVYMQQLVASGYPASKQAIIVDEMTLSDWMPEIEITMENIQDMLYEVPSTESFENLILRAMQGTGTDHVQYDRDKGKEKTILDGKAISNRLDREHQLTNWLGELGKKYAAPLLYLKIDNVNDPGLEGVLERKAPFFLPMIIKALLQDHVKWQKGELANSRIRFGPSAKGGYSYFISEPRQFVPVDDHLPPIIFLDATANTDEYARLLGKKITLLRMDVPPAPGYRHIANRIKRYGIESMTRYNTEDLDRAIREIRFVLIEYGISQEDIRSGNVGLITFKDCRENMANALGIPLDKTLHFGNLRGKNDLRDCETLLVVGTPRLPTQTLATMTRTLHSDESEPISEEWTRENGYSDVRMKERDQRHSNSELTQAAHRNRPVRFENRTVISFCQGDIDFLPITEEITQFPSDINDNGQNESEVRDDVRKTKLEVAYDELSKEGKRITIAALSKKAGVRNQTAKEWMNENPNRSANPIVDSTLEVRNDFVQAQNVPKGDEPMINPDDIQRYHGIEKGAKVITPLGQGTVVLIRGIGPRHVRVTVSVDRLGWKSFKSEEVKPFIQARQEPLPTNAGLDALFAGIGG